MGLSHEQPEDNTESDQSSPNGHAEVDRWYYLCPDQNLVGEFSLKAGVAKDIRIKAKTKLWVGFGTDAPQDWRSQTSTTGLPRARYPIVMCQPETGIACSNRIGQGTMFTPVKNAIKLVVTNTSTEHFRTYVITIPSVTNDW